MSKGIPMTGEPIRIGYAPEIRSTVNMRRRGDVKHYFEWRGCGADREEYRSRLIDALEHFLDHIDQSLPPKSGYNPAGYLPACTPTFKFRLWSRT